MNSFLHSPAWEAFQKKAGATVNRYNQQLFIERQIPLKNYWLGSRLSIPQNFEIPDWAKDSCFLRLEPLDDASFKNLQTISTKLHLKLIPTFAVQPRQTSIVDVTPSYEDILKKMKQKHRYNIKVAEKHEVEVEIHTESALSQFDRFWNLLETTATRHNFRTHDKEYYRLMIEELEKEEMVHLLFAKKDTTDLAALILITYEGTATYLHGGSIQAQKEAMAPYKLHAETILFAKSLNLHSYDLWGTDLIFNEDKKVYEVKSGSSSSGTSRFKLGFGGEIINYPGTFDLVLNPFYYSIYKTIRALRGGKRSFS